MGHYNNLSPSEQERLAILVEELAECQWVIGKILRHGYESVWPDRQGWRLTNREVLIQELGDVLAAIDMMVHNDFKDPIAIEEAKQKKIAKQKQWLHHN